MAIDRDLEVAVVAAARRAGRLGGAGWEMTAATGVRGLRALVEGGALDGMLLTESHPAAYEVLAANAGRYANLGARAAQEDVRRSAAHTKEFRFVDLDPYGSPAAFVDGALAALDPPGLLAVTATDLRVLGGADPITARRKYGGVPVRGRLGPESGLRLLLAHLIDRAAARNLRARPLLAYVRDHHVRAYCSVADGAGASPDVRTVDPASWTGPPLVGTAPLGPFWMGPLLDRDLVTALLPPVRPAEPARLAAWIAALQEELGCDVPFYHESNEVAARAHLAQPAPVDRLIERLRAAGHRAVRTPTRAGAFRTDATNDEVERIARAG